MTLSFRYKEIRRPDGTRVRCPLIPIIVKGKEVIETMALLDSGADISAMPHAMAEALGLDLKKPTTKSFGIGGTVEAIQTTMMITVQKSHEAHVLHIPVMVIKDDYQFPILLGRQGFFSAFSVTFDEINERVMLKRKK